MNQIARKSRFTLAFAGITAGLVAMFGVNAEASTPKAPAPTTVATVKRAPHNHATDCNIVAAADRALCKKVQTFHPYGAWYGTNAAYWTVPSGIVNVHELTHDGLTKFEMHAQLEGYAVEYREWVTAVPVDMDAIYKKCHNTDGRWIVSYHDEDGRPGGLKLTYKRIVCA